MIITLDAYLDNTPFVDRLQQIELLQKLFQDLKEETDAESFRYLKAALETIAGNPIVPSVPCYVVFATRRHPFLEPMEACFPRKAVVDETSPLGLDRALEMATARQASVLLNVYIRGRIISYPNLAHGGLTLRKIDDTTFV